MSKIKELITPEVLIISNKFDFSCDYVADCLEKLGVHFLRLNTDDFQYTEIALDPCKQEIWGSCKEVEFKISENYLKCIYFRAPTFLRESSRNHTIQDQLKRSQWSSFTRSLMMYTACRWVNHPMMTYRAESKPYQLSVAKKLGFNVPETVVANYVNSIEKVGLDDNDMIVKSLDAILLSDGNKRGFVYTNTVSVNELNNADLSLAPVIIQQLIEPKVDLRVTVIGSKLFAFEIIKNNKGVSGDWRLYKKSVEYVPVRIPIHIQRLCIDLVSELGLEYGAIDLVKVDDDDYYFLEINPTGEWAWLVDKTDQRIDLAIAKNLAGIGD